jgi:hypothetical protein
LFYSVGDVPLDAIIEHRPCSGHVRRPAGR